MTDIDIDLYGVNGGASGSMVVGNGCYTGTEQFLLSDGSASIILH